jgi:hypothetical protein
MENVDHLEARQVHVSHSQSGRLGLFDTRGMMVVPLDSDDNPEMVARACGCRLVQEEAK